MSRYSCNFAAGNCSAACSIGSSLNILRPEYEEHYLTHVCTISLEIYIYYTMWNCKYDIHCTCNLSVMMSLRNAFIFKTPMFECLKTPMFQLMFWHQNVFFTFLPTVSLSRSSSSSSFPIAALNRSAQTQDFCCAKSLGDVRLFELLDYW